MVQSIHASIISCFCFLKKSSPLGLIRPKLMPDVSQACLLVSCLLSQVSPQTQARKGSSPRDPTGKVPGPSWPLMAHPALAQLALIASVSSSGTGEEAIVTPTLLTEYGFCDNRSGKMLVNWQWFRRPGRLALPPPHMAAFRRTLHATLRLSPSVSSALQFSEFLRERAHVSSAF